MKICFSTLNVCRRSAKLIFQVLMLVNSTVEFLLSKCLQGMFTRSTGVLLGDKGTVVEYSSCSCEHTWLSFSSRKEWQP